MTVTVLDSPDPRHVASSIAALKAQGLKAAILYISPINLSGDKTAKKPAIDAIRGAGVDVGFVCEGWGGSNNFSHRDINATCGARDGAACGHWLDQLGAPDGTAVYAAVDNDARPAQIEQLCLPYFRAFRAAFNGPGVTLPKYRLGVYGCGALLEALDAAKLVDLRWLSNAMGWSGSRAYRDSQKWDILQGLATHIDGIDIDPDQLNAAKTDFGFWKADPPQTSMPEILSPALSPASQAVPALPAAPVAKSSLDLSRFAPALMKLWPHGDDKIPGLRARMIAQAPVLFPQHGFHSLMTVANMMGEFTEECGGGIEVVENLNYRASQLCSQWPKHFTQAQALSMQHNPHAIANQAYNGRMGNRIGSDDGATYIGRGPAQTTGRDAYLLLGKKMGVDLLAHPELINTPDNFLLAGITDFVEICGCLPYAERDDEVNETRHLNGGLIGLAQREASIRMWKHELGIA